MKRILIVEDDNLLNKTLAYNLTSDGYEVTGVLNARTATTKIISMEYDLVLLDLSLNGKPLTISSMGFKMLHLFRKNPKQVLTLRQLLERLWDVDENYVDEHTLTTAISRIRGKIEVEGGTYIRTIYGMGYQWMGGEKK